MTADEQRRIMDRLIDLHCDECGEEICTDECQCQDCRENADMKAGTVLRGTQYYVSGPRLIRAVVSAVYKARSIESLARRAAGHANSSVPVVVIEGNSEPQVHGASYWKTNWSNGHGFSKTLYTPSTQHITVGALWSPWDWSEV